MGTPTLSAVYTNSSDRSPQPLPGLPFAGVEAQRIGAMLRVQPLLGDQATETRVRRQMRTADVIHLATHGLLEYGSPHASGVLDAPGAIALAPDRVNDGLLTAAEISTLSLQANLVVPSACDTWLGDITGDGMVVGLSRSRITAGAESVLVSLWAVPDRATAALMQEFYRQWQSGLQGSSSPTGHADDQGRLSSPQQLGRVYPNWQRQLNCFKLKWLKLEWPKIKVTKKSKSLRSQSNLNHLLKFTALI